MERARVASETLALIGLPALVFDERGKVLAANHLIEALTDHICWRAQDRVSLKDPGANALFAAIAVHRRGSAGTGAFFRRARHRRQCGDGRACLPIRRRARDIFVRCAGVLVMTPVTLPKARRSNWSSRCSISRLPKRVWRASGAGEPSRRSPPIGGVSRNTVRTQVRGVLEKTGCRRQAEVVALLGGIAVPQG